MNDLRSVVRLCIFYILVRFNNSFSSEAFRVVCSLKHVILCALIYSVNFEIFYMSNCWPLLHLWIKMLSVLRL